MQFLYDFDLLGEVLRVGVAVEVLVGGSAEPVGFGSELIREIGVVILCCIFGHEMVGIGRFASEWEITAGVLICGLYVLIFSFITGEMRRVRTQLRAWTAALQQILRHWSFQLIAALALESFMVRGTHIQMWSLQSIVLLIMIYNIGDNFLLIEALLIDGVLGEIGFDDVQFAEMPAAVAITAHAIELIMVVEVGAMQLRCSFVEGIGIVGTFIVIVFAPLSLHEPTTAVC